MSEFTISAKRRQDAGKGASRRLRRQAGEVPAIVYGGDKPPQMISVPHKDLKRELENEAFFTSVLSLDIEGSVEKVVLKDLQRHPAKPKLVHADFMRIDAAKKINMRVPLHFLNEEECVGVKKQGGIISHAMTELEVVCLPGDLPEYIEVDMTEVEVGQAVHISELTLPKGVESVDLSHGEDHDLPVSTVQTPRGGIQEEEEAEAEAEEAKAEAAEAEEQGEEQQSEDDDKDDESKD